MAVDPYKSGMLKKSPYVGKRDVKGSVVAILDFSSESRGLQLISQPSRAVVQGQVHEMIITDDTGAGPDQTVNRVSYLAFVSIEDSGVLLRNDTVYLNDEKIGVLAGFDETHMPNHQNVLVQSDQRYTGKEKGIQIGDVFRFVME